MKSKWILVPVISALCLFVACSKNSSSDEPTPPPGPAVDSSKCRLSEVSYPNDMNMPYFMSNFFILYDSLNRISFSSISSFENVYSYEPGKIIQRMYNNRVADSNLANRIIYTLDNNGNIVTHTRRSYFRPKSEDDYKTQEKTNYEYDAEGYLTGLKLYAPNGIISKESKFTYQNGNLARRENTYYTIIGMSATKEGGDTLTYTYDNMPYNAEAAYLFEVGEYGNIRTGKPNKNNVTGIQLKKYEGLIPSRNSYTSIQYVYSMKGPKLEKVSMTATTSKGATINTSFGFKYVCN